MFHASPGPGVSSAPCYRWNWIWSSTFGRYVSGKPGTVTRQQALQYLHSTT
jgi:hypothetical protein